MPDHPPVAPAPRRSTDASTVDEQPLDVRTQALLAEMGDAEPSRRRELVDEVVTTHLWLARHLARRTGHRRTGHRPSDQEDLNQVACLGLVEACLRFDPDHATAFVVYATSTINGLLRHYLRDHTWPVRPPRPVQELALVLREHEPRLTQELESTPTTQQLAQTLDDGTTPYQIGQAQLANHSTTAVSLDHPDSSTYTLLDPTAQQAFEACEVRLLVERLLLDLDSDDQDLLRLRFVDEQTQAVIARHLRSNQMAVSRRLKHLMTTLRHQLEEPTHHPIPATAATPPPTTAALHGDDEAEHRRSTPPGCR